MFILKIIAAFAAVIALYRFMLWFNSFTYKEAKYHFFTTYSFGWYAASYVAMYAGYHMARSNWQGDPLNGMIILFIGLWIFIVQIKNNFKHTRPLVALAGSLAQSILYIPMTLLGLIALFVALAAASGIRPVFCVNGD